MEHIRNRSVLLGWIQREHTWILTEETRSYWEVFIALLYVAQNIVRISNVLTVRLASGVKSIPPPPMGTSSSMALYLTTERPSRVYAHRSVGQSGLNVREDLGLTDHTTIKTVQFHQYPTVQVQDVELYDEHDVLRQGG